eukprot:15394661-Alexandrium_andersonii.AAC.1
MYSGSWLPRHIRKFSRRAPTVATSLPRESGTVHSRTLNMSCLSSHVLTSRVSIAPPSSATATGG